MKNFIQWKGTDLCMDFHCDCGHHNHYDGFFAYHVKCFNCEKIFKLSESIKMTEIKDTNGIVPLESESND